MRRPTRLSLAVVVLVLAIVGAYSAYWFTVAGRLETAVRDWAQTLPAQNLDLSWREMRVGGFPFALSIELADARLRDRSAVPAGEVQAPLLVGSARPWNPFVWRLLAPNGLTGSAGPADNADAKVSVRAASGVATVASEGGGRLWVELKEPTADAGLRVAAKDVELWLDLPPRQPQSHGERALGVALDVRGLTLPVVPVPLQNPVDEIAFGATVMGAVPGGPPRRAAAAWRDSGGTLELEHFALRWGPLRVTLSGTLALDGELQPMAAFSGAIEGYDELMAALVAAGRLRASDARLARLALAMLARAGPGGRPEIATSFTIQNGEMYLGPVRLGKAPRIDWP
jgi:hypothetical protein